VTSAPTEAPAPRGLTRDFTAEIAHVESAQRLLLIKVFLLMAAGLLLTALVSFGMARHPESVERISGSVRLELLLFAEIASVAFIARNVERMTPLLAAATFICYSAVNGVTFAVFFAFLPPQSVALGFACAALALAAMAPYGRIAARDLTPLRNLSAMSLLGLALATLINASWQNPASYWATSFLGVVTFAGLTTEHMQYIRDLHFEFSEEEGGQKKAVILGALLLYLDFVNIYLHIMRLLGRGRPQR
jgi:FtsH-binding integral membrane protein